MTIDFESDAHDNCDGCRTLNKHVADTSIRKLLGCLYQKDNADGSCPCTLCLIKMMCNTSCGPFDIYNRKCNDNRKDYSNDTPC